MIRVPRAGLADFSQLPDYATLPRPATAATTEQMAVELPIDHLAELWPRELGGRRIGAVLHPASVNSKLEHTSQILERKNGKLFQLRALFGPQHGYRGETQDNMIEWRSYEHPRLGIPV